MDLPPSELARSVHTSEAPNAVASQNELAGFVSQNFVWLPDQDSNLD